jgi:hypothetical protein
MRIDVICPDILPSDFIEDVQSLLPRPEDGVLQIRFHRARINGESLDYEAVEPVYDGSWPEYMEEHSLVADPSPIRFSVGFDTPPLDLSAEDLARKANSDFREFMWTARSAALDNVGPHISRNTLDSLSECALVLTLRGSQENLLEYPIPNLPVARLYQVNHSATQRIPAHVLLSYHILSLPLRMASTWWGGLAHSRKTWGHETPQGCINDIAREDQRTLLLKIKTADICDACEESLRQHRIDLRIVEAVREGLEQIRATQLGFERLMKRQAGTRVEVGEKVWLPDLNQTLPFPPRERALYVTFLQAGASGITLKHIADHAPALRSWYGRFFKGDNPSDIAATIDKLVDPHENNLNEVISKANSRIRKVLGDRGSEPFLIQGTKGGAYRIVLPREFVQFAAV